ALHPGLNLRIGAVTERWGTGMHTTRAAQLVPFVGGGYVVDTPGLQAVGTWGVDPDALGACFPEFRRFLDQCRFDNCRHLSEPECAVRRAASRALTFRIICAKASSRSIPCEFARQITTNRTSASSIASDPSASSCFLVFSPKRWLISRASSPTSSVRRARFVSGEKYPSLYWPIQRSTVS